MPDQTRAMIRFVPALLLVSACSRAEGPFTCPSQIDVRQQISAPVSGWTPSIDNLPNLLAGITFFDGKPEERATLAPDSESKINGKTVSTWKFGTGPRQLWVSCRYSWTTITLARELPKSIKACVVTYNPRQMVAGMPSIEKLDCK